MLVQKIEFKKSNIKATSSSIDANKVSQSALQNEIKKVFPEYANVYSNAISKALNTSHLKRTLFKYENAIALLLSNSTYKYKVNDDKCRTEIIDYMYYYLGFSVIKYSKKGNIEFDYSSGFVNGDVGEFLTNLEIDNKRKKFPIYTLINMLNTYVFIDDGTNSKKSYFDSLQLTRYLQQQMQ